MKKIAKLNPPSSPQLMGSKIESALADIECPGEFHAGGAHALPYPGLHVTGFAEAIALPLPESQAQKLAALARQCPHGKGLETVVDTSVRDCLEFDATAVTFSNPAWPSAIDNLVTHAATQLGVPSKNVTSSLYKLLLYQKGGHFKPHRDTEKTKGMFATLTVQLPSSFRGGALIVRHQGQEKVYAAGAEDGSCEFSGFYTAFFADVEHEISPVIEGYRLSLVYSLSWVGNGAAPTADQNHLHVVSNILRRLAEDTSNGAWILSFGLEHQYTDSSLSQLGISTLKGKDRAKIGALTTGSRLAMIGDVELFLCKLSRTDEESGDGYGGSFDVYDREEGVVKVEKVYCADGSECSIDFGFIEWESRVKDGIRFAVRQQGQVSYTGNEGATRETTYSATAVILWPKNKNKKY